MSCLALDAQWWSDIETIDSRSSNCRWGQGSDRWGWNWKLGQLGKIPPYTAQTIKWNRFYWIKSDPSKFFLCIDITVRTRTTTLVELSQERLEKLYLIDDLYQQGLNSREIADHLNELGIRTPKGGTYYSRLVWVTQKKFKRRQERMKDTNWTVDRIYPATITK